MVMAGPDAVRWLGPGRKSARCCSEIQQRLSKIESPCLEAEGRQQKLVNCLVYRIRSGLTPQASGKGSEWCTWPQKQASPGSAVGSGHQHPLDGRVCSFQTDLLFLLPEHESSFVTFSGKENYSIFIFLEYYF